MFQFIGVTKQYGAKTVLSSVDLTIPSNQTTVLLGPSGSGKSTLLAMMAGLIRPDAGELLFDGSPIRREAWPVIRRKLGYVIQDGGLFPHLNGRENAALMARHLGWKAERIEERMLSLAQMTQLSSDVLQRFPAEMSGGQRQRVSLIRALMLDPEVLLLDEPLGALDPIIRSGLQNDLVEIFRQLKKTVAFVTHDLAEAAVFADQMVLMHEGHLVQKGAGRDFWERPATAFVQQFMEAQKTVANALL